MFKDKPSRPCDISSLSRLSTVDDTELQELENGRTHEIIS